ncbi:MAG: FAD-binding oxidoreductase [Cyanobacteria bacterium P01_F01_bin.150]
MNRTEQLLSNLPGDVLKGLHRADQLWATYRQGDRPIPTVVHEASQPLTLNASDAENSAWDVVICGGTLGIMLGAALVQRGWKVAVLERGELKGRDQEWNISRKELRVLTELELLTDVELEGAIASEYNPARLAFHKGIELWVEDVLNIGVDPVVLIETLKRKFLAGGGKLFEYTAFKSATIHPNGVEVHTTPAHPQAQTSSDQLSTFTARMVIDAMGHFSPIAGQARKGQTPDAICMVVGTCAQGFLRNETGDLFASFTPMDEQRQYFWEAFPARDGRTTYMFTYIDAHPKRPSLEELFEDYWRLLPDYQGVNPEKLKLVRALFGFFPCYQNSPLQLPWNRMLAVGDSSGNQSPLSFGGFGAMLRHLSRLTNGIHDALECDRLSQSDLALLQPYQPNLSVTWLFQRSMSVAMNQGIPPNQINELLSAVFEQMQALGMPVLKPFLQDVVQLSGLFQSLIRTTVFHPIVTLKVLPQVGILPLLNWMVHYASLAGYTGLSAIAPVIESWSKGLTRSQQYTIHRYIEAWRYGAGLDHCAK